MANDHVLIPVGPMLQGSGTPAWLMAPTGDLICCNSAFQELLGLPQADLVLTGDHGAILPGTAANRTLLVELACPQDRPTDCHITFRQHNGKLTGYDCLCRPITTSGRTLAIFGRVRDARSTVAVPDQQMRAARGETQHRLNILEMLTETSAIGTWYFDLTNRTMRACDNFFKMLGYAPGEIDVDSEWIRSQIHPDDLSEAVLQMEGLIAGKRDVYQVDYRFRCKDGTWKWFQATGQKRPATSMSAQPFIYGSLMDISDRKLFEQQIAAALQDAENTRAAAQRNEEIMRVTSESGNVVPWTKTPATGESWFGGNLNRLLGIPPETVVHAPDFRTLIHPDDVGAVAENFAAIDEGKSDDYAQNFRVRHTKGGWRWFTSRGSRISRSEQGLPDMICGSLTNIDQLKQNEERLVQVVASAEMARVEAQASEDMLRASAVSGLIGPWNICPDNDTGWMMDVTYRMMGYRPGEFAPNRAGWRKLIHPDDAAKAVANMKRLLNGASDIYDVAHRLRHKDGSYHWFRTIAQKIDRAPQDLPFLIAGAITPIGHVKENETRLAEAAEAARRISDRLTSIADNAPAGLFEFRLHPNGTSDLQYSSARFDQLVGHTHEDIQKRGINIFDRVHPADKPGLVGSIRKTAKTLNQWSHRFRLIHPEHGVTWMAGSSTPKRLEDGTTVWVGTLSDVTNDVHREAELRAAHQAAERMRAVNEKQALHDVLTELPNRRYFDQILSGRLASAKAGDGPKDCVLIRIDADRFKYINDTLGHGAGDDVLVRIARIMAENIRASDFGARIGGDEFSIILAPGSSEADATIIVRRIQAHMDRPMVFNGRQCHIQASFGIAHVPDISALGTEIQSFADAALYRAKEKGRNRMEFFTPDLHRDFIDGQSLASELYDALENREFIPFFQPQVSAETGKLTGVEALVRWQHPQKGIVAPGGFLKVAEQLRIVHDIDRMMIERSSEIIHRLAARNVRLPKISFNVSAGRMYDPEIINDAKRIMQTGTAVTFELVESILVEEENSEFKQHLARIRSAGIDIEIDDFGSGHASIIGLMEVLPTALKIDRRIVKPVAEKKTSAQLVKAIIQIADALGIGTVAEGVETIRQAQILRDLGCDVLQGYLFARPLNETELEDYLNTL